MNELYQVIGYDKQFTRLAVTCRYPARKEYTAFPKTDKEMMEIEFVVVAPPGNSLKLYVDASVENPPHESSLPPKSNPSLRWVEASYAKESRFSRPT